MIVDSSAWIAHLRGTASPAARRLIIALDQREPMRLPDFFLVEVLRGARDAGNFLRLERAFHTLPRFVPSDPRQLARNAAHLYARCRWAGFTPGSGNDCLIARCALEAREPLLHEDRDFVRIAQIDRSLALVGV